MAVYDDAIITALRGNAPLCALLSNGASSIGHGSLPPGTLAPYLLLLDVSEVQGWTFNLNESWAEQIYRVIVYTQDTDTRTAQSLSAEILDAVKGILHNQNIAITGRKNVSICQRGRVSSTWTTITDQERYFRDGKNYFVWSAPDS